MQDTENAIKHVRLMANERKRLSSLANWKPQGYSVLQVRTAHFLFSSALLVSFYEHIPPYQALCMVCCHEYEKGSSQWRVIRFPNHRILSSCRLMFDRSSGKGKTQIGMAKFRSPKGFRGNLHTRKGVVFRRKNFANPILLPLSEPQERTNGDRKTQKKNGGFEETELVH